MGTVDFDTAGGAAYDFKFRGVDDPHEIVRTVDRALHELRLTHPAGLENPPTAGVSRRTSRQSSRPVAAHGHISAAGALLPPKVASRGRFGEFGTRWPRRPERPSVYARTTAGPSPAAARSASALSVRSHVKSWSSRPK